MKLAQLLPAGQDLDLTEKRNMVREFVSKDGTTIQLNVSSSRMYKDDATGINIITLKDLSEIQGLKIDADHGERGRDHAALPPGAGRNVHGG